MVVLETMAAISLVKGAVSAVNAALETADDASGIYNGLDKLFRHREAAEGHITKAKKAKPSRLSQIFSRTTKEDIDDDLSVGAVAAAVLEKKQLDRQILNLGIRIDNKFGVGTWDEILALRADRIKERDEDRAKSAAAKKAADKDFLDALKRYAKIAGQVILILGGASLAGWLVWVNRCVSGTC